MEAGSSSNHPFSGAFLLLVSGRVVSGSRVAIIGRKTSLLDFWRCFQNTDWTKSGEAFTSSKWITKRIQKDIQTLEVNKSRIYSTLQLSLMKKTHMYLEPDGHPFINGCFNWMIQNLYIGNGWKSPNIHLKLGVLGFQVYTIKQCRLWGKNHSKNSRSTSTSRVAIFDPLDADISSFIGSTTRAPGCQWQIKVYFEIPNPRSVNVLVVTVFGLGGFIQMIYLHKNPIGID